MGRPGSSGASSGSAGSSAPEPGSKSDGSGAEGSESPTATSVGADPRATSASAGEDASVRTSSSGTSAAGADSKPGVAGAGSESGAASADSGTGAASADSGTGAAEAGFGTGGGDGFDRLGHCRHGLPQRLCDRGVRPERQLRHRRRGSEGDDDERDYQGQTEGDRRDPRRPCGVGRSWRPPQLDLLRPATGSPLAQLTARKAVWFVP